MAGRVKGIPNIEATEPDIPKNLAATTNITINDKSVSVSRQELDILRELGRGRYGKVIECKHKTQNFHIAVKQIPCDPDHKITRELMIGNEIAQHKYLIKSYGAFLFEAEIWVILPLMDLSLDKLLNNVVDNRSKFSFYIVSYIAYGTIQGLEALHVNRIIHRDVKPSNLLVNKKGDLKLCDYGISGTLVNSVAKTNVGSQRYLAPERIDSVHKEGFSIKSDVWSLGLSVLEIASLKFPYQENTENFMEWASQVLDGPSPTLPPDSGYPIQLKDFIDKCLIKDENNRPNYIQLLQMDIFQDLVEEKGSKLLSDFVKENS